MEVDLVLHPRGRGNSSGVQREPHESVVVARGGPVEDGGTLALLTVEDNDLLQGLRFIEGAWMTAVRKEDREEGRADPRANS